MDKNEKKIMDFLEENTMIQSKELKNIGFSSSQIKSLLENGFLERINRGLYTFPNSMNDPYLELQLKFKKLVFSHVTALSLHGLTDVTPSKIMGTVPRDYNYQYISKVVDVDVVRVITNRYELGIEEVQSPFGNKIKVYDIERTLCDILLKRNIIDNRIINEAFKNYFTSEKLNLNKLMKYAKLLRVEKHVRNYVQVYI